jgi:MoaA/NifB/PqqE/SkfB family radical SAM enzyme
MSQLKSVVWYISHICNFSCPYCFWVQSPATIVPHIASERWVEAWNRLKPEVLDITGGEPFLQPRFVEMLNGFDPAIKVAITSNMSQPLDQFIKEVPPKKVFSMTLSYHPTQTTWEQFSSQAVKLRDAGFNLTVNYVGWLRDGQVEAIDDVRKKVEALGIRFHLDPYVPSKIVIEPTAEQMEIIKRNVKEDRTKSLDNSEIPHKPCLCGAGQMHLQVECDGIARRCGRLGTIVGNILDPDFKLYDEPMRCDVPFDCQSCDYDKTKKTWKWL